MSGSLIQVNYEDISNNRDAEFDFTFETDSRSGNNYVEPDDGDGFDIEFPDEYEIPSEISADDIVVNSDPSNGVEVNGSSIFVESPRDFNGQDAEIEILSSAGIINPNEDGEYEIDVTLEPDNTGNAADQLDGSFTVDIQDEPSTISSPSVTPSPSVAERRARYNVEFELGGGGRLPSGETITLQFDEDTQVTSSSDMGGVTINGTSVSAAGDGESEVTITTTRSYGSGETLNIEFSRGAGLENPPEGEYTLDAKTSVEDEFVESSDILISAADQLSFSSISLGDSDANALSKYEIGFITGEDSDLLARDGDEDDPDLINFQLPENTELPSSISTSRVQIATEDGFISNPEGVNVEPDSRLIELSIPFDIDGGSEVEVEFSQSAGLRNPSQADNPDPETDNYTLQAFTTQADGDSVDTKTPSNPYNISTPDTEVSSVEADLDGEFGAEELTTYTINFDTGDRGRLDEEFNTVSVRFPSGTELPDEENINASIENVNVVELDEVEENRIIELEVPEGVSVSNNSTVEVEVEDVTNPEEEGTYSLSVKTSAEPSFVRSSNYQIGDTDLELAFAGPADDGDDEVFDDIQVNEEVSYFIDFDDDYIFFDDSGTIFVRFPQGTIVPSDVSTDDIDIDKDAAGVDFDAVDVQDDRTLRFDISANNPDIEVEEIFIQESANILLPTIPREDYNIRVWSNQDQNPETGDDYELDPRTSDVSNVDISASPNVAGENARYIVEFETSENGRMRGETTQGSNTIFIQFPDEFNSTDGSGFPDEIPASEIEINGNSVSEIDVVDTEDQIIAVDLPSITIDNLGQVEVRIGSGVGIKNPDVADEYQIGVRTDVDAGEDGETFTDGDLEIEEDIDLSFTDLSLSDNEVNAPASYLITFRTGTGDDLGEGDQIEIEFDETVGLPDDIGRSRIQLAGENPDAASVQDNSIIITLSDEQELEEVESYDLNISSNAGVLNPFETGTYTFDFKFLDTDSEVTSDSYNIEEAGTTISQPEVSLGDNAEDEETEYDISFSTGSRGRLPGGGEITVDFPSEIGIDEESTEVISLNEESLSDNDWDIEGQTVEITVPEEVSIRNSSSVDIEMENITNPDDEGEYRVEVFTSIEEDAIESSRFFIGESGIAIIDDSFTIFDLEEEEINLDEDGPIVNSEPHIEFDFSVDGAASLSEGDELIIRFPSDSQIRSNPDNIDATFEIEEGTEGEPVDVELVATSSSDRTINLEIVSPTTPSSEENNDFTMNIEDGITYSREPSDDVNLEITSTLQSEVYSSSPSFEVLAAPEEVSTIENLEIRRSSDDPNEDISWEWRFNTGDKGALKPGDASIFLTYANEADVPESISTDFLTFIDANEAFNPSEVIVDEQQVEVVVPSDITIDNGDEVVILFDDDAGIQLEEESESNSRTMSEDDSSTLEDDDDEYNASTSPEPGATSTSDTGILPVELIEFVLNPNSEGNARLTWKTATENENEGFRVERKLKQDDVENGGSEGDWKKLDFIDGEGTTTTEQEYTYLDDELSVAGTYEYRLIQEDYDGTSETFGPEEFTFGAPTNAEISQNYPNPFNPVTTIPYQVPEETEVRMDVYNVLGERVQTLIDDQKQPGTYTVDFDGSRLASGVYIVRFQAGGVTETMEITLVK